MHYAPRLRESAECREADGKRDARRKIVVGGAVLAHAALHPDFAKALMDPLKVAVTLGPPIKTLSPI